MSKSDTSAYCRWHCKCEACSTKRREDSARGGREGQCLKRLEQQRAKINDPVALEEWRQTLVARMQLGDVNVEAGSRLMWATCSCEEQVLSLSQMRTTGQVARRFGMSEQRVRQLTDTDELACLIIPHGRLFDDAELDRFEAAREALKAERLAAKQRKTATA